MSKLRTLIACLMLLALPLQGLAAYAPAAQCLDDPSLHAVHNQDRALAEHAHHSHGPATPEGADQAGHACCHHVCPAANAALIPLATASPQSVVPRVTLLATLFIPDLPQRPPRA